MVKGEMYMLFIVKSRNASILLKIDNNKFRSELFLRCLLTRSCQLKTKAYARSTG